MSLDLLLQKTKEQLPHLSTVTIHPINKGGSARKFYRLITLEKNSLILVHYNNQREENNHYANLALFLKNYSLHVPEVLEHSPEDGLLWLEDLGEIDLWSQRDKSWQERRPLYQLAMIEAARFHRIPIDTLARDSVVLEKEFNEELYLWEQEYFSQHALGNLFNIDETTRKRLAAAPSLQRLAISLASLPRQLIHRDFQSQNLMVHNQKIWLIDFQGLRLGVALYDLASLLYDPYVTILDSEREEMLDFYQEEMKCHGVSLPLHFKKIFLQCAAQRLMQALGAYGFISIQLGKTDYRNYVTPALTRLREVLEKLEPEDQLPELAEVLKNLK